MSASAPGTGGGALTGVLVLTPDIAGDRGTRPPEARLAEAMALADALPTTRLAGGEILRIDRPRPGTILGSGKMAEIGARLAAEEIGLVVIDGPVSPVQQRNLERDWQVKVLDRRGLILEIFATRARTREGELQVELAALTYQRTRLVRAWTHLERQRGGLGFVGGPGETQIEADRRALDDQIIRLRRRLRTVRKTRDLHRSARAQAREPVIALVGYTNAGKSTLFNRLTGAGVASEDQLFATLDPTMRAIELPELGGAILSDTVGFIADLPHELVAAFRATLEEVRAADLIVHVRDIAHPETASQAQDVAEVLEELGVDSAVPVIEAWNKIDTLDPEAREAALAAAARRRGAGAISAATGEGIDALKAAIGAQLTATRRSAALTLGHDEGRARAWLHERRLVTGERAGEDGLHLDVRWSPAEAARFAHSFGRRDG